MKFLSAIIMSLLLTTGLSLAQGLEVNQGNNNTSSQTGGYAWIGNPNSQYLSFDNNEIQARFTTSASTLILNYFGGHIDLLGASNSSGDLKVDGSGLFYDNSTNRVGIGTSIPVEKLDVRGKTRSRGLTLDGISYFSAVADDCLIEAVDGNGADLFLISNDAVIIELDKNNDESGDFSIYNGSNDIVFTVSEGGTTATGLPGDGNSILTLNTDRAWTFRQYGTGSSAALRLSARDLNNNNKDFIINTAGNVGIGTDLTPDYNLEVTGSAGKPGGGSWTNSSDRRLKKDVRAFTEGLALIEKVNPIYYHYNGIDNLPTDQEYVGVIAQELKEIAPFMVSEYKGDDGTIYLAVDPSAFDFILINALKELTTKIEKLEAQMSLTEH